MRQANKWRLGGILVLMIVAGLLIYAFPINLGLDLRGGVHVVLEGQDTPEVKVNAETMRKAKLVIERRVNALGVAEPVIQLKGERQIIVDMPGLQDQRRAIELIGKTAVLEFRDPEGKTVITGAQLVDAWLSRDSYGRWAVSFRLNQEGAAKFEAMTRANVGRQAPIVLDNEIISNPVIQTVITGGEGQITGNFTAEEAKELVSLLKAGALPVPLKVVENRTVGPTLGKATVEDGIKAGIIGLFLVVLYMLSYYRLPGLTADLALGVYAVLLMGALAGLRATLTLPGIAGLILSIGMAVDANVLVFERIKEELQAGKHLRAALDAGFHRALPSIVDSNITTLITAAILFFYGTGAVRGFAVTLSLGILTSLFTALVVTRFILTAIIDRDPQRYARAFGVSRG